MNILNRKKQIGALVASVVTFLVLLKLTTPEIANGAGVVLMSILALLSRDDAPPLSEE